MGIKEVKAAFEEAVGDNYSCSIALMDMVRNGRTESQVLYFRGNDPQGAMFEIRSDLLEGNADLIQAAKDTALRLLNDKKPT